VTMKDDEDLLAQFVASFGKLDLMDENVHIQPDVAELAVDQPDEWGLVHWQPSKVITARESIDPLYDKLPARFPPLFERLVLSYRWAQIDLQLFTLLANPPGADLSRFFEQISKDPALWAALIPAGYLQFAKGPDMDYDPVCFDIKSRKKNGDCRVVKVDHEEILCNNRIKVVAELAPTFEELVRRTIRRAEACE
jgi:hypothetical protein